MNMVNGLKTRRILIEIYAKDAPDHIATYRDLDQLTLEHKRFLTCTANFIQESMVLLWSRIWWKDPRQNPLKNRSGCPSEENMWNGWSQASKSFIFLISTSAEKGLAM